MPSVDLINVDLLSSIMTVTCTVSCMILINVVAQLVNGLAILAQAVKNTSNLPLKIAPSLLLPFTKLYIRNF